MDKQKGGDVPGLVIKAQANFEVDGKTAFIIHFRDASSGPLNEALGRAEAWLRQKEGHPWVQGKFMQHLIPRQVMWLTVDGTTSYHFSGKNYRPAYHHYPNPITTLQEALVGNVIENFKVVTDPNSCLVNKYRDGKDSVSPHSDDEPIFGEKGRPKTIISVSLGAARGFKIQPQKTLSRAGILASPAWEKIAGGRGKKSFTLVLEDGDIVLMGGHFQEYFLHSIPKSKDCTGERFNLTFRQVVAFPPATMPTAGSPPQRPHKKQTAAKKARVDPMD